MKNLDQIGDIKGKKVLLRISLNVPVDKGSVTDPLRIEMSIPTINELRQKGGKVIILSHIGRNPKESLEPVARYLQDFMPVIFIRDIYADSVRKVIDYAAPGSVVLFENLRKYEGEEKNDMDFVKHLSSFGDIYVNDSFPECHREHASIVGIPKLLPCFAGRQLMQEIDNLSKAFNPEHPFLFILGGAKVETKLPLIKNFIDRADNIFIGGVLANDFFKASNISIGESVTSKEKVPKDLLNNKKIILPVDLTVERKGKKENVMYDSVLDNDRIFDLGRKSADILGDLIKNSKFVLWNGPLGYCEGGYCEGTTIIANKLAASKSLSVVGGGDTLGSIDDSVQSSIDFISTGGGAMLEFLAKGTLPGIEVLK